MSDGQLEFLQEGLFYCPSCNRSEEVELVYVVYEKDRRLYGSETPNVYPVALFKCHYCLTFFELERVDPRPLTAITEIDFQNEFVVYTTQPLEQAIQIAKKWYNEHYDGQLGDPIIQTVGTTIFTSDPRVIVIPK